MARRFDGSGQYGTASLPPQIGNGTLACWVKALALPASTDRDILTTYYQETEAEPFGTHDKQFFIDSAGIWKFRIFDGATKLVATTTGVSTGTWYHLAATMDGTNMRIYLNGTNEGTTAAGASYTGYTDPAFGLCRIVSELNDGETTRTRANADVADFGIWDVALTANEITALAKGMSPSGIRNPSRHWPLWGIGTNESNFTGTADDLVLTGSPTLVDHAPVGRYAPRPRKRGVLVAAAGGGLPFFMQNDYKHGYKAHKSGGFP